MYCEQKVQASVLELLCRDFCFEGSCELCQLEVEAGAQELGSKAQPGIPSQLASLLELKSGSIMQQLFVTAMCVVQASKNWCVDVLHPSPADRVAFCT